MITVNQSSVLFIFCSSFYGIFYVFMMLVGYRFNLIFLILLLGGGRGCVRRVALYIRCLFSKGLLW